MIGNELPAMPEPYGWSTTHRCPHCDQPLAIERVGPDYQLFCPHGQCDSQACDAGTPNPMPSEAQAYIELERQYQNELVANAEI